MTDEAPPRPLHVLLAWDAADLVVECLAQDDPRWSSEPAREQMHREVFRTIVRVMDERND
jgi:hypothetical protein